jgi:hypothetical protein
MMIRIQTLLFLICLLFVGAATTVSAQTNTTACKATCLGPSGSVNANGPPLTSPNQWLPCGGGTSEDNPLWWAFTVPPGVTTVSFNVTASNCSSGSGIQSSVWTGDDCAALSFIGTCVTGFGGLTTADVEPCKTYLFQIDGIAGDRCAINFTYPPSQILTKWDAPTIDGPDQVCAGSSGDFTATINGCAPPEMTWSVSPAATLTPTSTKVPPLPAHKVKVTFNNPGTYQVCARGKSRCVPTGTQGCKSVVVFTLPDVDDELQLCFEEMPYNYCNIQVKADEAMAAASVQYGITPNITGAATPSCTKVSAPSGMTTKVIPYSVAPSGCKGKINLKLDVVPLQSIDLGNFFVCDGDDITIAGKKLTCADAKPTIQTAKVIVPGGYPFCDTTYRYKLFCLKITPQIKPVAPLDCVHTSDILDASMSTVSPLNTASNTGTVSYKWNTNATTPTIPVTMPGTYTVTVTYIYTITDLPNNPANPLIATCSKSASFTVTGNAAGIPGAPSIATNDSIPCLTTGNPTYSVVASPGNTYNWTIVGGTLNTTTGTTVNATWTAATPPYKICATVTNSCGVSEPGCLDVNPQLPPKKPTIIGVTPICPKDTVIFSTTASTVPGVIYNWAVPAGANVIAGANTKAITVYWSGTTGGPVLLSLTDKCGSSLIDTFNVLVSAIAPTPPAPTGIPSICIGNETTYTVPANPLATNFVWAVSGGGGTFVGSNVGTSVKIKWDSIGSANLCVRSYNKCDTSAQVCTKLTIFEKPIAKAGSNKSVCSNTTNLGATAANVGTGTWKQVSGPNTATFASPNSPTSTVSLPVGECGDYAFIWEIVNGACVARDTVQVKFSKQPTISAYAFKCDPISKTYVVTFKIEGCNPPYTVTNANGSMGTVDAVTGIFTSNPYPSSDTEFKATIKNALSCTVSYTGPVDCNCITNAGTMAQIPLTACEVGGNVTGLHNPNTEKNDGNDLFLYVLHNGSGNALVAPIIAVNASGTFSFDATKMTCGKPYYISYVGGNTLNNGIDLLDPCLSVAPGQKVTFDCMPKPDAGNDDETCGTSYTLNAVQTNGSTGKWTVTGGSATITPDNSPTATAKASGFGTRTFIWTETSSACVAADSTVITFLDNKIVATPEIKTCDGAGENYVVKFNLSGGNPTYTVTGTGITGSVSVATSGGTFTSPSIDIKASPNYSFTITDSKNCDTIIVSGKAICNCKTHAGTIGIATPEVCEKETITVLADIDATNKDTLDANDIAEFLLADDCDPLVAKILDRNTTGIFTKGALACDQEYYIIHVVGNNKAGQVDLTDDCLSKTCKPVKWVCSPVADAGLDGQDTCKLIHQLSANLSIVTAQGKWTAVGTNAASVTFTPSSNNVKAAANVPSFGKYTFVWTETNGICIDQDSVVVEFFNPSNLKADTVITCNSSNTTYTVNIDFKGAVGQVGLLPGSTDPLNFNGTTNKGTSSAIPSGGSFKFIFNDQVSCVPITLTGSHTCPCVTNAGSMQPDLVKACENETIKITKNNADPNFKLDGNDSYEYILHEGNGKTLKNTIAKNKKGEFDFQAGMKTGQIYYVSVIAGDSIVIGGVDLNSKCKDIAIGQPVMWLAMPTAELIGDKTICEGQSATLTLKLTGTQNGPFDVIYNDGTADKQLDNVLSGKTIDVKPTTTINYQLVSVKYNNAPGCLNAQTDGVEIKVNKPIEAGTALADTKVCFKVDATIKLEDQITGSTGTGAWSIVSPSNTTGFNATAATFKALGNQPNTYTFKYAVPGQAPCPNDEVLVNIIINPLPKADAGSDQELNCDNSKVLLGGANTSSGTRFAYQWTETTGSNSGFTASDKNPSIVLAGTYKLVVTDTVSQCVENDEASITANINKITGFSTLPIDPSCFGDNDGSVKITDIVGGTKEYRYSLNDGPFLPFNQFGDLKAGTYKITVKDSKGCKDTSSITISNPPQVKVKINGELDIIYSTDNTNKLTAQVNIPDANVSKFIWTPSSLVKCNDPKCKEVTIVPGETTSFKVRMIDKNGCEDVDDVTVRVRKLRRVYIPNAFSTTSVNDPNARFRLYLGVDVVSISDFRVYDRWGNMVFEDLGFNRDDQDDEVHGWDGLFRGKPLNEAVFSYSVKVKFIDGLEEVYKGDVTLIRK